MPPLQYELPFDRIYRGLEGDRCKDRSRCIYNAPWHQPPAANKEKGAISKGEHAGAIPNRLRLPSRYNNFVDGKHPNYKALPSTNS